jgi:hypothetical protein
MIEELDIQGFHHKLNNTKLNYPQCNCSKCPKIFFNLLSIASRQSGKTHNIVKLLKHYEENHLIDNDGKKHPMRVILISPTSEANPIYKSLNSLDENDIFESYTDTLMDDLIDDIKKKKQDTDQFKYEKAFKLLDKHPKINCLAYMIHILKFSKS